MRRHWFGRNNSCSQKSYWTRQQPVMKESTFAMVNTKPRRKEGTNPHKNQKTQNSDKRNARSRNKDGYPDRLLGRILGRYYEFSILESIEKEVRSGQRGIEGHCEVVVQFTGDRWKS